jgi:hypothetical protein
MQFSSRTDRLLVTYRRENTLITGLKTHSLRTLIHADVQFSDPFPFAMSTIVDYDCLIRWTDLKSPEDGDSTLVRNVGFYKPVHTEN